MAEAAGRLFVDVTQLLASPAEPCRKPLALLGRSDPLVGARCRPSSSATASSVLADEAYGDLLGAAPARSRPTAPSSPS